MKPVSPSAHASRGVTLVVVLLILLVVTVLGIGSAQIALLAERSTRYDRDYLVASQAAEAALMDAEFDIRGPNASANRRDTVFVPGNQGIFVKGCGTASANRGLCEPVAESVKPNWQTVDFLDTSANPPSVALGTYTDRVFESGSAGIKPELPPRYIIEWVVDGTPGGDASSAGVLKSSMYRVTAIGFGPRKEVQVVLQMAFKKDSL